MAPVMVGTAGWSIAAQHADRFPGGGSHLERYSRFFAAVEINSSFYRPHRPSTYARWAASVPAGFCFAVKMPREITHTRRLADSADLLARFLSEIRMLGPNLGPVLVQFPPSFAFSPSLVTGFLAQLRESFDGSIACEPRHVTWFTDDVDRILRDHRVARVAADPALAPRAAEPGGYQALRYFRLHGSPRMYYSAYSAEYLDGLAERLFAGAGETWCIFDNTAEGSAMENASTIMRVLPR